MIPFNRKKLERADLIFWAVIWCLLVLRLNYYRIRIRFCPKKKYTFSTYIHRYRLSPIVLYLCNKSFRFWNTGVSKELQRSGNLKKILWFNIFVRWLANVTSIIFSIQTLVVLPSPSIDNIHTIPLSRFSLDANAFCFFWRFVCQNS